jgi:triosephosphate isomerase
LYGGSVNEKNAAEILKVKNVDGVLVGGASLDPQKFYQIIQSTPEYQKA